MKVSELIEFLKKQDQNANVNIVTKREHGEIKGTSFITNTEVKKVHEANWVLLEGNNS